MSSSHSRNEPVCGEVSAQTELCNNAPAQTELCDEALAQTESCEEVPAQTESCDEVPAQTKSKTENEYTSIVKGESIMDGGSGSNDSCAVQTTDAVAPVEEVTGPETHYNVNVEDAGESLCDINADSTLKGTDKKDDKLSLEEVLANKLETISIYFKLVMHPKNHSMLLKVCM